jgi:hypothetical protein
MEKGRRVEREKDKVERNEKEVGGKRERREYSSPA